MKNYNVEAIIAFKDIEENIQRVPGDIFKCTKERYEYLMGKNPQNKVAVKLLNIDEEIKEEIIIKDETGSGLIISKSNVSLTADKPKKATKRKVK